ncbi:LOW QUALITY PROTEIN: beta-fructofuranosidase, insoluble isoenzyme 1-like [Lolium rigidum]|uniref:LOW QUALITY PROTEIN: beta-fructofuranosidase, insoluble isoenzyme 1-like n=1 Tax=Lolium rigidum TaxID=89674 RepID=UPI001F5DE18B|nr:LOW QUALITY PROTEIN: beta-fructofuranosidase, insoluble isoenzyme 1-like [Lolium rigidum]
MGNPKWVLAPWAVLLLLQLACASHHARLSLETEAASPSVPASIVSPLLRTGYHFQPPMNWINDPNGPLYYKGWYHLFYQYNPKGAVWGNIIWAHSVSRDLINWIALEPAISPSIPTDQYGVWSGSTTILHDGTPAILYTGIDRPSVNYQIQNIALPKNASDPLLREWYKPGYNPIAVPVAGINATQFRDPTTAWFAGKHWRMLVGPPAGDLRGEAILYRSRDFKNWTRAQHPLHSALTGMWECPDFFPVGKAGVEKGLDTSEYGAAAGVEKHVLKNSLDLTRYDYYTIGTYDNVKEQYVPDNPTGDVYQRLQYDYGNFYASKTFFDPVKHRRILLGWANESDSVAHDKAKGWAGIQAIPRKIWLDPSGKQLVQWPVEEIEKLRCKPVTVGDKVVKLGQHFEITGLQSYQSDVEVSFEVSSLDKAEPFDPAYSNDAQKLCGIKGADVKGGVGPFGLWVLSSADLAEKTAVFFRVFKDGYGKPIVLMCSDPTKSSLTPDLYKPTFAGFVDTDISSGKISLRSLIDRSVVESFGAGGKTCILSRVYPSMALGKDAHLHVFNNGETDIKVSKLTAWEMKRPLMNGA